MNSLVRVIRRSRAAGFVADIVKWLRNPRLMRRLLDDVRTTSREAAFIRSLSPPRRDGGSLLILSMSDSPYNAKLESALTVEFRRRGWRIQVLTSGIYTTACRIFAAFGITELVHFESLVWDPKTYRSAREEVARRAAEPMDFRSVMQWTYRDAWIGPQLLASASRSGFTGAPDPADPEVRAWLLRQLPVTVGFVHAAESYIDAHHPDLMLVNEPNNYAMGPFVDVAIARGIPVVQFVQPSRDDALVFKRLTRETRRIHPNSVDRSTLERMLGETWTPAHDRVLDEEFRRRYGGVWRIQERNQPGTIDMTAEQVRTELGLDATKRTAVMFSHVLWDANLFYGTDLFDNYGHWFVETVKAAVANSRLNWVIKLHPANLWKRELAGVSSELDEIRLIREHIGELPSHVHLLFPDTKISTLSLFRMADVGITVRGSIGYEMPCFGVPVVTAGTGRFSGFGFTLDHATAESYLQRLAGLESIRPLSPEATHRARVHAYALLALRPWPLTSFRVAIGRDVVDPLNQNLHPTVRSFAEIARNGDLAAFADWAEDNASVDYLTPDPLAQKSPRRMAQ